MKLICNPSLADHLHSPSQKARVISEAWFAGDGYCLNCSSNRVTSTTAGTIARDYVCPRCGQPYELKSSSKLHTRIVSDGGYASMLRRIHAAEAPALMLLHYSPKWQVQRLLAVHPVFLTPQVVMKRKSAHTRKSGKKYQMCDLNLTLIPPDGKIVVVENGLARPHSAARRDFQESKRFGDVPLAKRGWAALVLSAVRKIGKSEFASKDIYAFADEFHSAYPNNNHIEQKIRQQLQVLRDLGYLEFPERGRYRTLL